MGSSILNGLPKNNLSKIWYTTGDKLAEWILIEVPCSRRITVDYTEALLKAFQRHSVPFMIRRSAFLKLKGRGILFDWPPIHILTIYGDVDVAPPQASLPLHGAGPPNYGNKSLNKKEVATIIRATVEEYERKYVLAIRTNDVAGAEAILVAVLTLIWEWLKGHGEALQTSNNETMREWNEFNTAVDQALDRARTLQTHVRYLSREDVRALRAAPTPNALRTVTIRLAPRLTSRTMPRTQRTRR